eukprot:Rhum_TRINITY_DN14544_c6_g1::Rhum_TRINITY_DN14544_c6_g1_i1::g.94829::m.94829
MLWRSACAGSRYSGTRSSRIGLWLRKAPECLRAADAAAAADEAPGRRSAWRISGRSALTSRRRSPAETRRSKSFVLRRRPSRASSNSKRVSTHSYGMQRMTPPYSSHRYSDDPVSTTTATYGAASRCSWYSASEKKKTFLSEKQPSNARRYSSGIAEYQSTLPCPLPTTRTPSSSIDSTEGGGRGGCGSDAVFFFFFFLCRTVSCGAATAVVATGDGDDWDDARSSSSWAATGASAPPLPPLPPPARSGTLSWSSLSTTTTDSIAAPGGGEHAASFTDGSGCNGGAPCCDAADIDEARLGSSVIVASRRPSAMRRPFAATRSASSRQTSPSNMSSSPGTTPAAAQTDPASTDHTRNRLSSSEYLRPSGSATDGKRRLNTTGPCGGGSSWRLTVISASRRPACSRRRFACIKSSSVWIAAPSNASSRHGADTPARATTPPGDTSVTVTPSASVRYAMPNGSCSSAKRSLCTVAAPGCCCCCGG